MKRLIGFLVSIASLILLSACTSSAPVYSPSFQNVQKLGNLQSPIRLGSFSVKTSELDKISMRADTLVSPSGSFASYLQGAVESELKMAHKLGDASALELSAIILENDLSVPVAPGGEGNIRVNFILKNRQESVFQKEITGTVKFPSSLFAAIAIPNAIRAYPDLVTHLLGNLYGDTDFFNATKK